MPPSNPTGTSKLLSLILRHRPQDFGVVLDAQGWTPVDALLAALTSQGTLLSRAQLEELVRTSDKQRFALSADGSQIRANQGHSVAVELDHEACVPPARLFHGTVERFLPSIRRTGLVRGRRHHVHLSASPEQAAAVGARRGSPLVLEILAGRMSEAGHLFLLSPNGVWLTERVPPNFILLPP